MSPNDGATATSTTTGEGTAPSDGSGAAPTSPTSGGNNAPPASITATGFRFTQADVDAGIAEPWMVGKTGAELARISRDLYHNQMNQATYNTQPTGYYPQQGSYQPQYVQQAQQSFQPQQPQQSTPALPTDDDWATSPSQAAQKFAEYMQQTQFNPANQQAWQATGSLAFQLAQTRHKDAFDKWGPEIVGYYNQLDAVSKANPQNIDMIVSMVRGNHVNETVKEIEERVRKDLEAKLAGGGSLRPDTSTGVIPPSDPVSIEAVKDKLPPEYYRKLREHNVTDATLEEFLLKQGDLFAPGGTMAQKKEAWLKEAMSEDIITEKPFRYGGE